MIVIKRGRNAFFQYAKEQGFDPLLPSNWYSVDLSHLLKYKASNLHYLFNLSYLLIMVLTIIILGYSKFIDRV